MQIKLVRLTEINDTTLGVLMLDGWPHLSTLELRWNNNQRNISSIPMGTYRYVVHVSPRFGKTIRVEEVPERDGIIVHRGNTKLDTRGCILVGTAFGYLDELPAVRDSRRGMKKFRNLLGDTTEGMLMVTSAITMG